MLALAVVIFGLAQGQPQEATVAEILRDPDRYGGQIVRVRGEVNGCAGYDCGLCPEEMTPATYDSEACLNMSFHAFSGGDTERTFSAARLIEDAFRFSVVTLTARVDPQCLTHRPWPPEPDLNGVVICTDRASVLVDARVEEVHLRHRADDGLPISRLHALLPAEEVQPHLIDDYFAALPWEDRGEDHQFSAWQSEVPQFSDADDEALLCICREADCTGRWPSRIGLGVLETPNNPYDCYWALKWGDRWRLYID